ncbi:MAG: class I tRNA ligase family protein [Nanoarchaeota archaeon]
MPYKQNVGGSNPSCPTNLLETKIKKMSARNIYTIDMPPPTISGQLHMGHAFSYTQMDFLARYHQMKGKQLIYPFCYDNNGIPTEKFALKQGIQGEKNIMELSHETSKLYYEFFEKINMGFSNHRYDTYGDLAEKIAILSFNDLKEKGLIYKAAETYFKCEKCEKSIPNSEIEFNKHSIDGGNIIEENGEGWFIKTMNFKEELKAQIEKIEWKPEKFKARILDWIDNMDRDWSISRKREYGIRIPGETELRFDTWFTSSLSPQMAWASHTGEASLDCPIFDIRFQAHDIITTWALYTIIKSYHHNGQIPWKKIIITGHATDNKGEKLSKSEGNFLNPYYYINNFGGEGIRYWSAQNQIGTDTMIDETIMANSKKLMIKWKNAKKFIAFQESKGWIGEDGIKEIEWEKEREKIDSYFEDSDWPKAFHTLNDFFWKRFCDTFIEESKKQSCSESLKRILNGMINYWEIFFPNIKEHEE